MSIAYQVLGEGELDIVFVPGVISHLDLLWEDAATSGRRRGVWLGAEGPVTDHAWQGELTQVRHVGLLLVDEQAGGDFVGYRSQPAYSWITSVQSRT